MNKLQMYEYIEDECCRLLDFFELWFEGKTFYKFSRPEIMYAPMTIDAAQCLYAFGEEDYIFGHITFNSHMITEENFERFIEVVAPHEISHWVTAILNGYLNDEEQNLNHGYTWSMMMEFFESDPKPHIYDLHAPMVEGLHQYGCSCCTVNLSDEDIELYEMDLHCPNCNCDFQMLVKRKK